MPPSGASQDSTRSLILMRHGETAWNRQRRIMGSSDVPLSDAGRRQCQRVADLLPHFGIDRIVSSPLVRAVESSRIIAEALSVDLTFDQDIEAVKFGCWQGRTYDEVMTDPAYHAFHANPLEHATPGGETILDVQRRGLLGFDRVNAGEGVLFVSHGDIIRSAICRFLGIPVAEFRRIRIDNCGLSAIDRRQEQVEMKFINMLADPERAWNPLHWSRAI